jgi:hypothetical protein
MGVVQTGEEFGKIFEGFAGRKGGDGVGGGLSEFLETEGAHTGGFVEIVEFVGIVGAFATHHFSAFPAMVLQKKVSKD